MKKHTISKNDYLTKDINAFYRCEYIGYGKPGNPDYLNVLKNTFNTTSYFNLLNAKNLVKLNLINELSYIINTIPHCEIAICVVPRSKSLNNYSKNQLLFIESIVETIPLLNIPSKQIIDGTNYLIRHTDTRTTHIKKLEYAGDGPTPYPGITNDTCIVSNQVAGKHIVLIDDIYTRTVNVDEDAIQCLINHGASSVTFFSIAYTRPPQKKTI